LADESVHVVGVNVPPALPSFHIMVPEGEDAIPLLVSVTVPVKVIVPPVAIDAGLGVMSTVVVRRLTVSDDVPELATCVESPE
jgi:hypothetical protein